MQKINRILLIRTDRIGDVVLTTPAASILHQHDPNLHIAFLSKQYTEPLLRHHRHIDDIVIYDPLEAHRGLRGHLKLAGQLRKMHFDVAILFYPRPALAATIFLAGVPLRIGIGYRWYSFLLNRRVYEHRKYGKKHELEYNLSLLTPFIEKLPSRISFDIDPPSQLQDWRRSKLTELGLTREYVIIHPGNGGSAPNLSIRQYQMICRYLLENTRFDLLFSGTPEEKVLVNEIIKDVKSQRVFNAAGQFSIEQLMSIIAGARLYISSSTGPLHIANAFNIPIIGCYCPARACSPTRWGPYHQPEWVLMPPVTPCERCHVDRCPHGNCVEKIADKEIFRLLEKRLESIKVIE